MRTVTLCGVALAALALLSATAAHAQNTPVALTAGSYNSEVILTAGETSATQFNNDGNALYANGYNLLLNGLPTTGTLPLNGDVYQLASYTANNVLNVGGTGYGGGGATGTVTLTTPGAFSSLSFLTTTQYGSHPETATLLFSDSTTSNYTFTSNDYYANYDSSKVLGIDKFGLANAADGTASVNQVEFTASALSLSAADTSKTLTGITFTSGDNHYLNVFAVSGTPNVLAAAPEPSAWVPFALGTLGVGVLGLRRRSFGSR